MTTITIRASGVRHPTHIVPWREQNVATCVPCVSLMLPPMAGQSAFSDLPSCGAIQLVVHMSMRRRSTMERCFSPVAPGRRPCHVHVCHIPSPVSHLSFSLEPLFNPDSGKRAALHRCVLLFSSYITAYGSMLFFRHSAEPPSTREKKPTK